MRGPSRKISEARKGIYYLGISLIAIGLVSFLSVFVSAFSNMGDFINVNQVVQSVGLRSVGGITLMLIGTVMMRVGARGVAGSGMVLDPQKAREDLEPWSRMAGGMLKDALDETDLDQTLQDREGNELPFDEKLRRLEQLRNDGLITEAEYQEKRKEFLNEEW